MSLPRARGAGLAVAACLVLASPAKAETPDYPAAGIFQSIAGTEAFHIRCEPPDGTRMACRFSEASIARAPAGEPVGADSAARMCGELPGFAAMVRGDAAPEIPGGEMFRRRIAHWPAEQKADMEATLQALGAYCAAETPESLDRLAGLMQAKIARTCVFNLRAFQLEFDWNAGSSAWESRSAPNECGTLTMGSFDRTPGDGSGAWTYRIRDGVADPDHPPAPGARCPAATASEELYAAMGAEVYVGCDYVRFTD